MGERFGFVRTDADMQKGLNALDAERLRVLSVRLQPDAAATASIQAAATPTNGQVVVIDDGEGNTETFEFTDGGGLTVGTVEVNKSATTTGGMTELGTAINGSTVAVTASAATGVGPWDLPLAKDTQGAVGNTTPAITTTATLTLTQWAGGANGNLTAAAASQTTNFPGLGANSVVVAAAIQVDTALSGGAVSAVAADVGDVADPNKYVAAQDVLTATGLFQGAPGVAFTGLSGLPFLNAASVPQVTITATGGNVQDLDTGDMTVWLLYTTPALG